MAHGVACRVRLITDKEYVDKFVKEHKLDIVGKKFIYDIRMELALTAGLGTFMSIPNNVFNGTTVPAKVFVDSTDALDDTGATDHLQKAKVIGIVADGTPTIDEINMNGTTGNEGAALFRRLIHGYGSSWGSGGKDAAGTIHIQDDVTGTTKYLEIAIGANETEGLKIWLGDGWFAMIEMEIQQTAQEDTSKIGRLLMKAVISGCQGGDDPDYDYEVLSISNNSPSKKRLFPTVWKSGVDGSINFQNSYIGATASALCIARILVFKRVI